MYRKVETFENVIGQKEVLKLLKLTLEGDDLPHTLILFGEAGIGKTTIARLIAASSTCLERKDWNPCGTCENCKNVFNDKALEIIEVDGALNSSVEDIRNIIEVAQYKPRIGLKRFFIIDEAQRLSIQAFSAMLKTLEESAIYNYFILTTTNIEKIPDSIISRSIRLGLRTPSKKDLKSFLNINYADLSNKMKDILIDVSQSKPRNLINALKLTKYVPDPNDLLIILGWPRVRLVQLYWFAIHANHLLLANHLSKSLNEGTNDKWNLISYMLEKLLERMEWWALPLYQSAVRELVRLGQVSNFINENLILNVLTSLLLKQSKEWLYFVLLKLKDHPRLFWRVINNRDKILIYSTSKIFIPDEGKLTKQVNLLLCKKD